MNNRSPILAILFLTITACAANTYTHKRPVPAIGYTSRYGFPIYSDTPLFTEHIRRIDNDLAVVTPEMRGVVKEILLYSTGDPADQHFGPEYADHTIDQNICLSLYCDKTIYTPNLWHECAHAYTHYLNDSYDGQFSAEWQLAAGDNVYGKDRLKPEDGILTSYGSRSHIEDIAEWVRFIYCVLHGPLSLHYLSFFTALKNQDSTKNDPRWRLKLTLLYKWKFIPREIYDKLLPLTP